MIERQRIIPVTPGGGERMRGSLGPGEHDSPPSKIHQYTNIVLTNKFFTQKFPELLFKVALGYFKVIPPPPPAVIIFFY